MKLGNMLSGVMARMKSQFIPTIASDAKIAMDGSIVVKTNTPNGKEWVSKDAVVYPEDMLLDFPVYVLNVKRDQISVGDIIRLTATTFGEVVSTGATIKAVTFGGDNRNVKEFKDFLMGEATISKVVNPFTNVFNNGGDINSILPILMIGESEEGNDFAEMLALQSVMGQNGNMGLLNNPIMLIALSKKDGNSSLIENLMLMQMMQGNALFQAPKTTVPNAATSIAPKKVARKK